MSKQNPDTKSKRIFRGRTSAYKNFYENIWKTQQLLKVGLSGISGETEKIDELLEKFDSVEGVRGPLPKDYEPEFESRKKDETGNIEFKMDSRSAWVLKKALEQAKVKHTSIRFHLYAILAVAIWGAFETYLVMLYDELYRRRPEILKSDENITFREVLEHQETVLDFLIERQIDKVGHFTLTENLKYLKSRLSFEYPVDIQQKLADYYLVRNIVAHNLGVIQGAVRDKIPESIVVKGNQIQITKAFLEGMIKDIQISIVSIEKFIIRKFF